MEFLTKLVKAGDTEPNPGTKNRAAMLEQFAEGQVGMLNGITTYDGQIGSDEWNNLVAHSKFAGKSFADFAKVAKGKISLQQHPGSSAWRNIKIRELK